MSVSPCGRILWRLRDGAVFALKNFNNREVWFEVAQEVTEAQVNDYCGVIVKTVRNLFKAIA